MVFHAGTIFKDGQILTAGGRVLAVTAVARTLEEAVKLAYKGVATISFQGMQYRKDIAARSVCFSQSHRCGSYTLAEPLRQAAIHQ